MYTAIIMTGFGSLPFEYRYEAISAATLFALTLNNGLILGVLGFQVALALGRRRGWTRGVWAPQQARASEYAPERLVDALPKPLTLASERAL